MRRLRIKLSYDKAQGKYIVRDGETVLFQGDHDACYAFFIQNVVRVEKKD